ncbi:hypothetical protein HDU79_001419 [Rhizoclosmatium sp. JEL0117]|nr:hypothetical protein HDU79_001419 [Rhizoclosmatium sp. JEL0117]
MPIGGIDPPTFALQVQRSTDALGVLLLKNEIVLVSSQIDIGKKLLPIPLTLTVLGQLRDTHVRVINFIQTKIEALNDLELAGWWDERRFLIDKYPRSVWDNAIQYLMRYQYLSEFIATAKTGTDVHEQSIELNGIRKDLESMQLPDGRPIFVLPDTPIYSDFVEFRPKDWYQRRINAQTEEETSGEELQVVSANTGGNTVTSNSMSSSTRSGKKRGSYFEGVDEELERAKAASLAESQIGKGKRKAVESSSTPSTAEIVDLCASEDETLVVPLIKVVNSSALRTKPQTDEQKAREVMANFKTQLGQTNQAPDPYAFPNEDPSPQSKKAKSNRYAAPGADDESDIISAEGDKTIQNIMYPSEPSVKPKRLLDRNFEARTPSFPLSHSIVGAGESLLGVVGAFGNTLMETGQSIGRKIAGNSKRVTMCFKCNNTMVLNENICSACRIATISAGVIEDVGPVDAVQESPKRKTISPRVKVDDKGIIVLE